MMHLRMYTLSQYACPLNREEFVMCSAVHMVLVWHVVVRRPAIDERSVCTYCTIYHIYSIHTHDHKAVLRGASHHASAVTVSRHVSQ